MQIEREGLQMTLDKNRTSVFVIDIFQCQYIPSFMNEHKSRAGAAAVRLSVSGVWGHRFGHRLRSFTI